MNSLACASILKANIKNKQMSISHNVWADKKRCLACFLGLSALNTIHNVSIFSHFECKAGFTQDAEAPQSTTEGIPLPFGTFVNQWCQIRCKPAIMSASSLVRWPRAIRVKLYSSFFKNKSNSIQSIKLKSSRCYQTHFCSGATPHSRLVSRVHPSQCKCDLVLARSPICITVVSQGLFTQATHWGENR